MTTKSDIGDFSNVGDVRAELHTFSGQDKWLDDKEWNYFRGHRNKIMKAIVQNIREHLDAPDTIKRIEDEFRQNAKAHWATDHRWVLAGDWLDRRSDIVSWMRANYLRNNKVTSQGSSKGSSGKADGSSSPAGGNGVGTSTSAGLNTEVRAADDDAERGKFWNVVKND